MSVKVKAQKKVLVTMTAPGSYTLMKPSEHRFHHGESKEVPEKVANYLLQTGKFELGKAKVPPKANQNSGDMTLKDLNNPPETGGDGGTEGGDDDANTETEASQGTGGVTVEV